MIARGGPGNAPGTAPELADERNAGSIGAAPAANAVEPPFVAADAIVVAAAPALAARAAGNPGIGRATDSAWRIASRVKSCTNCGWRKRTSIFAGWTFTSTSSYGMSRNSSTTGKTPGGTILR